MVLLPVGYAPLDAVDHARDRARVGAIEHLNAFEYRVLGNTQGGTGSDRCTNGAVSAALRTVRDDAILEPVCAASVLKPRCASVRPACDARAQIRDRHTGRGGRGVCGL